MNVSTRKRVLNGLTFGILVKDKHTPYRPVGKNLVLYRIKQNRHNHGDKERVFLYLRQLKYDKVTVLHIVLQRRVSANILIEASRHELGAYMEKAVYIEIFRKDIQPVIQAVPLLAHIFVEIRERVAVCLILVILTDNLCK